MTIGFDSKKVPYNYPDLNEVVPAYAISVHKSQGSEHPVVVIPILTQHYAPAAQSDLYSGYQGKEIGGRGEFQKGLGRGDR